MSGTAGEETARRRWRPFVLFIIPLMFGLLGLCRVIQSPHFESYRTMDVVQLFVSGAGFGVALTGLMFILLRPNESPKTS